MRPRLNDYEIDAKRTEPFARPHAQPLAPLTHLHKAVYLTQSTRQLMSSKKTNILRGLKICISF